MESFAKVRLVLIVSCAVRALGFSVACPLVGGRRGWRPEFKKNRDCPVEAERWLLIANSASGKS